MIDSSTLEIAKQIAREMRDFQYEKQCIDYLQLQVENGRIESPYLPELQPIRNRMVQLPWSEESEDS